MTRIDFYPEVQVVMIVLLISACPDIRSCTFEAYPLTAAPHLSYLSLSEVRQFHLKVIALEFHEGIITCEINSADTTASYRLRQKRIEPEIFRIYHIFHLRPGFGRKRFLCGAAAVKTKNQ